MCNVTVSTNESTHFAVEPNCFRMLRDCRSMLAMKSNQLFYLTSSVLRAPEGILLRKKKMSTQDPAVSLHQVKKVQTGRLCLCSFCVCVCVLVASFRSCFRTVLLSHI